MKQSFIAFLWLPVISVFGSQNSRKKNIAENNSGNSYHDQGEQGILKPAMPEKT